MDFQNDEDVCRNVEVISPYQDSARKTGKVIDDTIETTSKVVNILKKSKPYIITGAVCLSVGIIVGINISKKTNIKY